MSEIFPKGEKGDANYFTGEAYVKLLLSADEKFGYIGNVVFEKKARNNWHTHPEGQVLIVTDGIGYYQEKGKEATVIKKGDLIKIPANVEHWHGATADTSMTHLVITMNSKEGVVKWLEPVSDEEFNKLKH